MNPFLKEVAKDIFKRYKESLKDITLVFPGQRPAVFFRKYFTEIADEPAWMPEFNTINKIMSDISGIQKEDNLVLNYKLYKIYSEIRGEKDFFDSFYPWGEIIINDFDDLDKNMADASKLFSVLKSDKELEETFGAISEEHLEILKSFWQNLYNEEEFLKKEFIELWKVLNKCYIKLKAWFEESKKAYDGHITRYVAENKSLIERLNYKKVIFIGLNALNKSEKIVLKELKDNGIAEFYWNYDEFYMSEYHEAGLFIRENIKEFPPVNNIGYRNEIANKKINTYSFPSSISQAKYLPELLKPHINENSVKTDETVVIPGDEELLIPIISSIPPEIEKVNITMGYPLSKTAVFSLIENLMTLQSNVKKSNSKKLFYHKNLIPVLSNQLIKNNCSELTTKLINKITNENLIFVNPDSIEEKNSLLEVILNSEVTKENISNYLTNILNKINEGVNNDGLTLAQNKSMFAAINQIEKLISDGNIWDSINLNTYTRILKKHCLSKSISYIGEPLAGLQIMGLLETRAIDFKNVTILSCNEGVLPKASASPSFIPQNLRKVFGMQTVTHQDSIFAYYFYRLLQNAETINLCYIDTESSKIGEKSRFISQLQFETDTIQSEKTFSQKIYTPEIKPIIIKNEGHVKEKLDLIRKNRSLSPTAINSFLSCSLKFYFRYISEIKASDEINEDLDAAMFGNILHKTMEEIYSENEQVSAEKIDKLLSEKNSIKSITERVFLQEMKSENKDYKSIEGKNIILIRIINKYIENILKYDRTRTPFGVIQNEAEASFSIDINNEKVFIKGIIDRIDFKDGRYIYIDYKTGDVKKSFKSTEEFFKEKENQRKKEILQVFIYCLSGLYPNPIPSIYDVRNMYSSEFNEFIMHNKEEFINIEVIKDEFVNILKEKLIHLFFETEEFAQTEIEENCLYCDYKDICQR